MTSEEKPEEKEKSLQTLEEICQNTRAILRDVNKILDQLKEYEDKHNNHDTDSMSWEDLYNNNDTYT